MYHKKVLHSVDIARQRILGVNVSAVNYAYVVDSIHKAIKDRNTQKIFCIAAVHLVMECQRNRQLKNDVNTAFITTPDGMPLALLLRLYGHRNVERVCGPKLMNILCTEAQKNAYRIFIYGGRIGQSAMIVKKLKEQYPLLSIVGSQDTPDKKMSDEIQRVHVRAINAVKPDILFVGLGCPYQEMWMFHNKRKLCVPVVLGVGSSFDYISGYADQAPEWCQNIGLEWFWRLLHDPRRLWFRYSIMNIWFLYEITIQIWKDFILNRNLLNKKKSRNIFTMP